MREFFDFMVSFNINSNIQAIIVGYSELVSIAVEYKLRIIIGVLSDGVGNRSARLVCKIRRNTIAFRQFVIGDNAKVVGLIKI